MGFLKRFIVVENDESTTEVVTPNTEPIKGKEETSVEVDAEINSAVNIIDEIYEQNGLSDKSNSIFTIQALIKTLPNEMPTATKKNTVFGILCVSGKNINDFLNDAEQRISILKAAENKIVNGYTEEIAEAKADIETLKQAIETATIKIRKAEDIIKATEDAVDEEEKIIKGLLEFCSEMEGVE